jgi:diguanylate cyclase (GGDEF)-like protein
LANSTCKHYLPDKINNIEGKPLWDFFSISCSDIPLHDLLNTDDADINAKNIAYLKGNSCISSCELNNEKAIIEWSFNTLYDDESSTSRLIATGTDQTLQHLKSEKLSYLAMHDSLTGLPNRSLFMDRLEITQAQYKRNNEAFCLLYLDLDGFKPINDNLGHEAGDFILKAVAEILQSNLRAVDTAARLGGDEFGIILTNIKNRDNAAYVAQKCIDAVSQPFEYLTHQLQLGISIGAIYYPDHKCDLVQLINRADTAMYKAKKSGGNTFSFYD